MTTRLHTYYNSKTIVSKEEFIFNYINDILYI